jgi:hypothetical protein
MVIDKLTLKEQVHYRENGKYREYAMEKDWKLPGHRNRPGCTVGGSDSGMRNYGGMDKDRNQGCTGIYHHTYNELFQASQEASEQMGHC